VDPAPNLRGWNLEVDLGRLDDRLKAAVDGGLLSSGTAHRVQLAARLAAPQAGKRSNAGGRAGSVPVSGQALAGEIGLSRAAVHKHLQHLQLLGFAVSPVSGRGYRLERPFTDLVAAEAVLPLLLGTGPGPSSASSVSPVGLPPVGLPYLFLERCESTNRVLREASPGLPSGALVVTDAQTAGRGRLNRSWSSRPGQDLTFSVFLRPSLAPGQAQLLSLTAGLTVAEVLEVLPGLEGKVAVKWPNDVLLDEKKVCGILLEGSMDADRLHWAVVGIGLNVNSHSSELMTGSTPEEAAAWVGRPQPVSLCEHLGDEVPRAPLLAALLERFGERFAMLEGQDSLQTEVLEQLRRRDALAGRLVEISKATGKPEPGIVGEAAGLGSEGQLLVREASGRTLEIFAGDVTIRNVPKAGSEEANHGGL
jgi:BirA family biotin operon repressor/biotin-[acetyl-CoA-carboxylase] ligase